MPRLLKPRAILARKRPTAAECRAYGL